jgi:hypothetical protein
MRIAVNVRTQLAQITAPTLVLTGRHDKIAPPFASDEILKGIAQAKREIFEEPSILKPYPVEGMCYVVSLAHIFSLKGQSVDAMSASEAWGGFSSATQLSFLDVFSFLSSTPGALV